MGLFSRKPDTEILVVCTANICRSPMAEGLLRAELKLRGLEDRVWVASAGTHVVRPGQPADTRAQRICGREGIDIRKSRTRQVVTEDFRRYTYLLAMDQKNLDWLYAACPEAYRKRLSLMGSWSIGGTVWEIPDPYFGSQSGFEDILDRLHRSVDGFLASLVADMGFEQ